MGSPATGTKAKETAGSSAKTGTAKEGKSMRIRSALAALCFGLVGLMGLIGLTGNAWAARDSEASEKCMACHDEDHGKMSRSAHALKADARTPTCVSCHGPSTAHAEKSRVKPDRSFKPGRMTAADQSAVCMSCHDKDAKRMHWATSIHPASDVSCSNCHQVHAHRDKVLAKATQPDVCYACHKQQRAEAQRPSRHPLQEGKMACSDCHNAHGSAGPKLARRDSTNDTCYACHAEKRGPFVHAHEPVTEDCAICHSPHGSTVPGMLKARAPILCNQCHTPHVAGEVGALGGQPGVYPPPVAGQGSAAMRGSGINTVNNWQGRSCLNCHTQVHGSNNPASTTYPAPQRLFR
jgi:DmsE family decaheme c-type cytochrome